MTRPRRAGAGDGATRGVRVVRTARRSGLRPAVDSRSLAIGGRVKYGLWLILVILLAGGLRRDRRPGGTPASGDRALAGAFEDQRSGIQVAGLGVVTRILPDDADGGRHQRFILTLASGQTLLVAHNIDVAPRIPSLRIGDAVGFSGVYEWNAEGGVVHWTHHDPEGEHRPGWLEHEGRLYQ